MELIYAGLLLILIGSALLLKRRTDKKVREWAEEDAKLLAQWKKDQGIK